MSRDWDRGPDDERIADVEQERNRTYLTASEERVADGIAANAAAGESRPAITASMLATPGASDLRGRRSVWPPEVQEAWQRTFELAKSGCSEAEFDAALRALEAAQLEAGVERTATTAREYYARMRAGR